MGSPCPAHRSRGRRPCAASFHLLFLTAVAPLAAQSIAPPTTAATATPAADEESAVTLDVFTVNADKDVGFVAAASLAGGRMATDLVDTPVAYSVQTREFLDALNLTNLDDAIEWSVNTYKYTDNESGGVALGSGGSASTTRGVASNAAQRNFFAGSYNYDTYNLERLDYTRGPNSVLFGAGTISGTANAMTKSARLRRQQTDTVLTLDSHGSVRATLDLNRPIGPKVALRMNVLWDERNTWRDDEIIKRKAFSPALTVELTKRTELRVSGEYMEKYETSFPNVVRDQLSGWDGAYTVAGLEPLTGSSSDAKYVVRGVNRIGSTSSPEYWMWAPDGARLMNYAGTVSTVGYSGSSNRPINGQVPVAGSLSIQAQPILEAVGRGLTDEQLYGPAIAGSKFRLPSRELTNLPSAPIGTDRIRDLSASLSHRVGDALFLEVAANANKRHNYGNASYYYNNGTFDGFGNIFVDVNQKLPNGEPNPYYLSPYMRARLDQRLNHTTNRSLRLAAAYVKAWSTAELKFNFMGGAERQDSFTTRENGVLPLDPDSRQWGRLGNQSRLLHFTLYFDQPNRGAPRIGEPLPALNPQTGTTTTVTPLWTLATNRSEGGVIEQFKHNDYGQAAAHVSLWKKRVIVLGAYRTDNITSWQKMGLRALSYPAGFVPTARDFLWRPDAPDDYYQLTYLPKSAAGAVTAGRSPATSRPLDTVTGQPLAQYANDRFQNDYNPPRNRKQSNTKSVGTILHLGRGVALWANHAQTFNPPNLGLVTINYETPPASTSNGIDYGVRWVFGEGRIVANLSRFQSKEKNFAAGNPAGYSNFNPFITTNPLGDDNPAGTNKRGLGLLPDQWMDKSDRESSGYEFEVVANVTASWRLTANVGTAKAYQDGAYRDTRAWLLANGDLLKQIAADAGLEFDNNGLAVVPKNKPVSIDANAAANSYNGIQAAAANWVTGRQYLLRLPKYTANLFTDYRFTSGRLKGLRLGIGVNFRGPQVIGFHGADQIPDPSSPKTRAIDDPAVDAYTPHWSRRYHLVSATLNYPLRLSRGRALSCNLSLTNLLDHDVPIYNALGSRPYGGDITSPARIQVPLAYTYVTPRTYTLSLSFGF